MQNKRILVVVKPGVKVPPLLEKVAIAVVELESVDFDDELREKVRDKIRELDGIPHDGKCRHRHHDEMPESHKLIR